MKTGLKIYTSYVTEENIKRIIDDDLLPIFIIRNIVGFDCISRWSGTSLHFKHLSPSQELFWSWRDREIGTEEYMKRFTIELIHVDFEETVKKLDYLSGLCNARGVVLLGLGENPEESHRTVISDILWRTGYLEEMPEELWYKKR